MTKAKHWQLRMQEQWAKATKGGKWVRVESAVIAGEVRISVEGPKAEAEAIARLLEAAPVEFRSLIGEIHRLRKYLARAKGALEEQAPVRALSEVNEGLETWRGESEWQELMGEDEGGPPAP